MDSTAGLKIAADEAILTSHETLFRHTTQQSCSSHMFLSELELRELDTHDGRLILKHLSMT
jgi:hypothetical protein